MTLTCQKAAVVALEDYACRHIQNVLIEGVLGSGKTYLASHYAKLLHIDDFQVISPTVQEIRSAVDHFSVASTPCVLCIENLDLGVAAASYTLLKFLEEPQQNIYIVVTCRNLQGVPDTILSRALVLNTCPPTVEDITLYAILKDRVKYPAVKDTLIWKCVRTLHDVSTVLGFTTDQLAYFAKLKDVCNFKSPISTISWSCSHFPDNQPTPVELVIRFIMEIHKSNRYIQRCGIECIQDISSSKVSSNAALSKFLFDCKYGE